MARLAIGGTHRLMVETAGFPGVGVVAGRALPVEVVGGFIFIMATLAISGIGKFVIERRLSPGTGGMAG